MNKTNLDKLTYTEEGESVPSTVKNVDIRKENFKLDPIQTRVQPELSIAKDQLITDLNHLLADEFTVFTKTLNFHWNVEGPRFNSIHDFLGGQYKELLEIVDHVAERIRKLDAYPAGTLNEFQQTTGVVEHPQQRPDTPTMLTQLQIDHERILNSIRKLLDQNAGYKIDPGTEDFLVGVLRQHEDMSWRLKSHFS